AAVRSGATPADPYIIIYRTADSKSDGGRGPPHGVADVVFGVWLPTFERPGGGREGVRGQDRRYRSGRRRARADRELRGLRPGDEDRGRGQDQDHEGPPAHGVRRSRPRVMPRRWGEARRGRAAAGAAAA